MKKFYTTAIISSLLIYGGKMFSQNIAINVTGTAPANCAMLDISSTSMGLLIPRVSLTNVTVYAPLTGAPVTSLLVYSTTAPIGGGGVGYYYWDGAKWIQLLYGGSGGTAWLTLGNLGTTAGTNFIGTTDAKDLVFKTNGTEWMRILSGGNVGIGTTTPGAKLEVDGASGTTIKIVDGNQLAGKVLTSDAAGQGSWQTPGGGATLSCGTVNYLPKVSVANSTMVCSQIFDNGTSVGIGTVSPFSKISYGTTINAKIAFFEQPSGNALRGIGMIDNGVVYGVGIWAIPTNIAPTISNASMFLQDGGNVGIGTNAPTTLLDVNGGFFHTTYNSQVLPTSTVGGGLTVGWNYSNGMAEVNLYNVYNNALTAFQFSQKTGANTSSNLMTILGNGNVGIGTVSPNAKLEIAGPNAGGIAIRLTNTDVGGKTYSIENIGPNLLQINDMTAGFTRIEMDGSGNVGINTFPAFKLDVGGTTRCTGNIWTSDIRKKKDIQTLSLNGLDIISKLHPVTFQWKDALDEGMKGIQMGFIAQELEKILPTMVVTANDTNQFKGVKYNELFPILVKAIQEQQEEIINYKLRILNLETASNSQQSTIDKLQIELSNLKSDYDARLKTLEKNLGTKAEK